MRRLLTVGMLVLASATWTATAAWADTAIDINPGSLNKTADKYEQICDPNQGGGPYPGKDVWVFNLPKDGNNAGDFVSVTATWSKPGGGTETRTIPTDGGTIGGKGTSKAWIALPAGWTLTAASAVITGVADMFVVTHTCAAKDSGNPPGNPGNPGNPGDPGNPGNPGEPGNPGGGGGSGGGGTLPLTGSTTVALVALGLLTVAAGAALRFFYRRRNPVL